MDFSIEAGIFDYFPGMRLVVAAAEGMSAPTDSEPVAAFLREGWRNAAAASRAYGNPQSHPFIKPWGERMKGAGAPRKDFPSSIEALTRRAGKSESPFSIHPFVDFITRSRSVIWFPREVLTLTRCGRGLRCVFPVRATLLRRWTERRASISRPAR